MSRDHNMEQWPVIVNGYELVAIREANEVLRFSNSIGVKLAQLWEQPTRRNSMK